MKMRGWLTLAVAALASASVWALSPVLTGRAEPWDADGFYYVFGLVIAGLLAGLFEPRPLWAHYVGAVVGQLGYELLFLPVGPLFILGAAFVLGYSLVFLISAVLAGTVRMRFGAKSDHM